MHLELLQLGEFLTLHLVDSSQLVRILTGQRVKERLGLLLLLGRQIIGSAGFCGGAFTGCGCFRSGLFVLGVDYPLDVLLGLLVASLVVGFDLLLSYTLTLGKRLFVRLRLCSIPLFICKVADLHVADNLVGLLFEALGGGVDGACQPAL